MDDVKISGIIFKHGEDDFELWENFHFSKEDEEAIWSILMKYNVEGDSYRGSKKEIAEGLDNGQ